jgi:hypothetical protein
VRPSPLGSDHVIGADDLAPDEERDLRAAAAEERAEVGECGWRVGRVAWAGVPVLSHLACGAESAAAHASDPLWERRKGWGGPSGGKKAVIADKAWHDERERRRVGGVEGEGGGGGSASSQRKGCEQHNIWHHDAGVACAVCAHCLTALAGPRARRSFGPAPADGAVGTQQAHAAGAPSAR